MKKELFGELRVIGMKGCEEFVAQVDAYLKDWRKNNPEEKYVYPQQIDPRFWEAGDTIITTLHGRLDKAMSGEYKVYLNMPDPYPTIHDNPAFSIRFANKDIWEEETGYNYLTDLILE